MEKNNVRGILKLGGEGNDDEFLVHPIPAMGPQALRGGRKDACAVRESECLSASPRSANRHRPQIGQAAQHMSASRLPSVPRKKWASSLGPLLG